MKRTGTYNGGDSKKPRNYDDEGPSFEDELGMMESMDVEFLEGLDPNESANQEVRWTRPTSTNFDCQKDNLAFHWLDIDTTSGMPLESNPDGSDSIIGSTEGPVPIIRMYGVTAHGQSVMANVHGFTPYFYVSFPGSIEITDALLGQLRASLDQKVLYSKIFV